MYANWFPLRKLLPAYKRNRVYAKTVGLELFKAVQTIVQQHLKSFADANVGEIEPRDLVDHFCTDILKAPAEEKEATGELQRLCKICYFYKKNRSHQISFCYSFF